MGELNNIFSEKPRLLPKRHEQTIKPKIMNVLQGKELFMYEIIDLIPDSEPTYVRTTVRNMEGGSGGYKKALDTTFRGKYYISQEAITDE